MAIGEVGIDRANAALGVLAFPAFSCHHPARLGMLAERGAGGAGLFGAVLDLPAGDEGEKPLDPCDADLFLIDHRAEAADAFDGALGVAAVAASAPFGDDEPFSFIHAEGRDRDAEDIGRFADGIGSSVVVKCGLWCLAHALVSNSISTDIRFCANPEMGQLTDLEREKGGNR